MASIQPSAYASSLEQIGAELERLDLLIRFQVWRARRRAGEDDALRAAYVAEDEPEELLDRIAGTPAWAAVALPAELLDGAQARLDELTGAIERRTVASLEAGTPLRLVALAGAFGLGPFEVDTVVACLALELDARYERLYAYLHDDLTRRRPSVRLVAELFTGDGDAEAKAAARALLGPAAPLRRHRLLHDRGDGLELDPRVTRFLLGDDSVEPALDGLAGLGVPLASLDGLTVPAALRGRLAALTAHAADGGEPVLYLQGSYGTGRRTAAAACANELGRPLLVADGRRLAALAGPDFADRLRLLEREARLQRALLLWEGFDALLAADRRGELADLLAVVDGLPGPVFLTGTAAWEPADALARRTFVRIELPEPGYGERLELWRAQLDGGDGLDLEAVAGLFRLTGGQIRDAAATARGLATARDPAAAVVTQADLTAACRLQSNRKLAELAQLVTPHYRWDDMVLPDDQLAQLREIADQVRYRAVVYEAWGFDAKLALGKGLNVLFAGPPGTGKTMAADVLAGTLGVDLYRIDLSTVVSKYVGETEKNLARIFDEARTSNAILFFDEADALFGKRTQVRDAHDRYANVEVGFLLQRMEAYEGLVILATNLRKNLDEAFVRRLHFAVDFALPGLDDRRRIWERIWPGATPLDPALDLDVLARRVEVAGGSIRNIALASAFLAAADGGVVTMDHLRDAVRREYRKMGKVLTGEEFGAKGGSARAAQGR
jgi:SpoVK/Ycf46/Vps4 family AAA+-type ATPase